MKKIVLFIGVMGFFLFLVYGLGFAQCFGDFNCNGNVDGGDLAKFASSFGETKCSGDLYVDTAIGRDIPSRGGSADKPLKTISYALSQIPCCCGSTIIIAPGTYNENLTVDKDKVTIKKNDESTGDVIIDGGGQNVIVIDGARNVTILGLTIRNGYYGVVGRNSSAFEVINTVICDSKDDGLQVIDNSTAQLSDCKVLQSGRFGVGVFNTSSCTIVGDVESSNNLLDGFVVSESSSAFINQAKLITKNNSRHGVSIFGASSIYSEVSMITSQDNANSGILVFESSTLNLWKNDNQISNNGEYGITIQKHSNGKFINGTEVEGNTLDGLSVLENSTLVATGMIIQSNSGRGVFADDGSTFKCSGSVITGNTGDDVRLEFGARATLNGNTIGTISCDSTVLSRGDTLCP